MRLSTGLQLLLAVLPFAHGTLYESPSDIPSLEADFIVVGAGTAGSVVANRLSEDPNVSVLVIEAGPTNRGVLGINVPGYCANLGAAVNAGSFDWNFTTIPQPTLNNRVLPYARGHVLGGSSSVNCMIYTRGPRGDYDYIANFTGEDAWTWDNLVPFMQRGETFGPPQTPRDISDEFVPEAHGYEGPLDVVPRNYIHELDEYAEAAGNEVGGDLSYNPDMNTGDVLGFGWVHFAIRNGTRGDAGSTYLGEEYVDTRGGLNVLLNSRVTKLYPTGNNTFKTVEFTPDLGETWFNATARTAVILSAGPVNSPRILMHSGIGDTDELSAVGIEPLHHLPSVGKNVTEQPSTRLEFRVDSTDTQDEFVRNQTYADEVFRQWNGTRTGLLSMGPLMGIAWLRNPDDAPVPDIATAPDSPHYELYLWYGVPYRPEQPAEGNYLTIGNTILTPHGNGSIALNSSNPLDQPILDLNMLSSEWEIWTMRESLRQIYAWANASAWEGRILNAEQNFTTDEELDEWARQEVRMANHPTGGALLSPYGAEWGVLDPNTAVKGLNDLWVIDSSIFPVCPAAHTMAPTYIVGERGADFVKAAYGIA